MDGSGLITGGEMPTAGAPCDGKRRAGPTEVSCGLGVAGLPKPGAEIGDGGELLPVGAPCEIANGAGMIFEGFGWEKVGIEEMKFFSDGNREPIPGGMPLDGFDPCFAGGEFPGVVVGEWMEDDLTVLAEGGDGGRGW